MLHTELRMDVVLVWRSHENGTDDDIRIMNECVELIAEEDFQTIHFHSVTHIEQSGAVK